MSLNNRISFRDAKCASGGLVDLQAVPLPNDGDSPQATMETIVMGPEMSQNNLIGQSAEVDGSESHDSSCYDVNFLMAGQSVPSVCRHRVMLI